MIDCNICKYKNDYCIECKNGELFERTNVSQPKKNHLVTEMNIVDIAVICANMPED